MPKHLFAECPACGWDPRCAYLREGRRLSTEAVHDRIVEHVRLTDDTFHDRIESELPLS